MYDRNINFGRDGRTLDAEVGALFVVGIEAAGLDPGYETKGSAHRVQRKGYGIMPRVLSTSVAA
jgi:hypothetical protein